MNDDSVSIRRLLLRWAGLFAMANAFLGIVIGLRFLAYAPESGSVVSRLFTPAAFIGHFGLLGLVFWLALVPGILLLPARRVHLTFAVLLGSSALALLIIDTVVFDQYRFHLNSLVVSLVFGGAAEEIFVFPWTMWAIAGATAGALISGEVALASWLWRRVRSSGWALPRRWVYLLVGLHLCQSLLYGWADAAGWVEITKQRRLLPAYRPITYTTLLGKLGVETAATQPVYRRSRGRSTLRYPIEPLACESQQQPPNILFVVLDSWRYDMLDAEVTPQLHRWAQRGSRFLQHYSGGNTTSTGVFSMFYGLPGTYWHAMLKEMRGPVLIDELSRHGFQMGIFAGAKLNSPELDRTAFAGIRPLRHSSPGNSAEARDRSLTEEFIRFLDERDPTRPFFGFLFYDAIHAYSHPPDFSGPFQPAWVNVNRFALHDDLDATKLINHYKNCAHFVDSLAGRALDHLESLGLAGRTIIVITSDHGEEFNDTGRNYWGHNSNFSRFQTRVPFAMLWPGREVRERSYLTSHFDLAPTLLTEILGCRTAPERYSVGRSIWDAADRGPLLLSSHHQYAVMERDRITVVGELGVVDVLDGDYRSRSDAARPSTIRQALSDMSRFFSR